MKFYKKSLALVFSAVLAWLTFGLATYAADNSVIIDIQKRGVLKVGISTFVPWAMRDKNGNLVGFEIDVAKKVAEDMGVEVEFIPTSWGGMIPALIAKKFDVIISGMTMTPQRNLTVNFSRPYAQSGLQLVANRKLTGGFTSLEDFNSEDVTVTCRRGATPCTLAEKLFPKAVLRQFDVDGQALQEVINGTAEATMGSKPSPGFWITDYPDVLYLPFGDEYLSKSNESFAIRKGDPDALNYFSNWILINIESGWLTERSDFWFNNPDGWKDLVDVQS